MDTLTASRIRVRHLHRRDHMFLSMGVDRLEAYAVRQNRAAFMNPTRPWLKIT